MSFTSLAHVSTEDPLRAIRLIATDMDGTLTIAGKFTPTLMQAFEQLAAAGIPVLIVTGRSAGWVSGLVHYLPVWGAIAENGGLFYPGDLVARSQTASEKLLVPIADFTAHRQQLAEVFQRLQAKFPQLQESSDNRFRLTDWTFDVQNVLAQEIHEIQSLCRAWGWGFTYSTVQCHIKLQQQDKATGLQQVLSLYFPDYLSAQVLTVGDSPNDESLFDASHFPCSVGVANVLHYRDQLNHAPRYVTTAPEGEGFWELTQRLLAR